ncbi:oligopeptide/dipeptide ABC transporter ATP-binding protein [Saccharothrix ecbatanensis]|uniref:Oligopeptide/dipeptide ABC transporter ATP-binding protein n=1 Tax=Saccharothrix ecbatanensis TaxID=1105145 RepID=A0A7W9M339_9PSEU|nr:ABC transporter ATP-binding protein [Saccharothrix ecbatanensis]MBB5805634.1 oligopeptide/dipeptide ABC transporter ATP-binding protein [Saccharothrix ecbatanensis]
MTLLQVQGLTKSFPTNHSGLFRRRPRIHAVRDVSFTIERGRTLGMVGESGSGKSTTARLLLGLLRPDSGAVHLDGADVLAARGARLHTLRRRMPMVFQDPYSSLDPTWVVRDIVTEPLRLVGQRDRTVLAARADELLELVGLTSAFGRRYPHELSGGQRQRIALARALACDPDLVVLDEAVAALDVSTRAGIIGLLQDLQDRLGVAYLFISHDLALVRVVSHDTAVMYLGRIVETGPTAQVYATPAHPYTKALIAAAPIPDPVVQQSRPRPPVQGEVPSALSIPPGCPFHPRCPLATAICRTTEPPQVALSPHHTAACHHPLIPQPALDVTP